MGWFSELVGNLTNSTKEEVSEASHQARTDSGVRDNPEKEKNSWKNNTAESGYTREDAHPDNILGRLGKK